MRIAVIGGGIQEICIALELARRGAKVDLFESREALMLGASRHNEGKIHLSYVYANDAGFATARLMAEGAFSFASLLKRWLEHDINQIQISRPFYYAVHRVVCFP